MIRAILVSETDTWNWKSAACISVIRDQGMKSYTVSAVRLLWLNGIFFDMAIKKEVWISPTLSTYVGYIVHRENEWKGGKNNEERSCDCI